MVEIARELADRVHIAAPGLGLKLDGPGVLETVREVIGVAGTVRVRACGRSMWPTILNGSLVTLVRLDAKIRRGQIVLLDMDGMPVLHRVQSVVGDLVNTIGDACIYPDPPTKIASLLALATAVSDNRGLITLTGSWDHGIRSWMLYLGARMRLGCARYWRWLQRPSGARMPQEEFKVAARQTQDGPGIRRYTSHRAGESAL